MDKKTNEPAQALHEQQEWLKVTLSSIGDAVITTDTHGRVTFLNPVAEQLTGWCLADARGRDMDDVFVIVNESTRAKVVNPAQRALREGVIVGLANHTVLIARDGTERPIDDSAAPIRNGAGQVAGCVLVFRDITERHDAEARLQASELLHRRIFDTSGDGILLLDEATGRVTNANARIKSMLGLAQSDLMGKELWEIGVFANADESRAVYERLRRERYARFEHLPLRRAGLEPLDVEFVCNVFGADGGDCIQCNVRDITQRVRHLRQAKAQAEALADLHRRKDNFLAQLGHELRSPLAPIQNAVQLLRLRPDADPVQEHAHAIIERQVARMTRLIEDLVEVSRLSTGRLQVAIELEDLVTVARRAVETCQPHFDRRRQQLMVTLPAQPLWATIDAGRIEQAVCNLLVNASKYSHEGGTIAMSLEHNGMARLTVRDRGIGIAPEVLPHVFDLYTQAPAAVAQSQGGLGIGLTLVRRIAELHGGAVEAHSEGPGHGARFVLTLPMAAEPLTPAAAAATASRPPDDKPRVLVVEDDVDNADSLVMLLQATGYVAQAAYLGETALAAAVEFQPDVVLLDIGLPDIDGPEVAQRMARHPALAEVRFIALTGYRVDDRAVGVPPLDAAGGIFEQHLLKPIGIDALRAAIALPEGRTLRERRR